MSYAYPLVAIETSLVSNEGSSSYGKTPVFLPSQVAENSASVSWLQEVPVVKTSKSLTWKDLLKSMEQRYVLASSLSLWSHSPSSTGHLGIWQEGSYVARTTEQVSFERRLSSVHIYNSQSEVDTLEFIELPIKRTGIAINRAGRLNAVRVWDDEQEYGD